MGVPFPSAQLGVPAAVPNYGSIGDTLFQMAQNRMARQQQERQFQQAHALDADKYKAGLLEAQRKQEAMDAEQERTGSLHNDQLTEKALGYIQAGQHPLAQNVLTNEHWYHGKGKYAVGRPGGVQVGTVGGQTRTAQDIAGPSPQDQATAAMAPSVAESEQIAASRQPPSLTERPMAMPEFETPQPAGRGSYVPHIAEGHGQPHAYMPEPLPGASPEQAGDQQTANLDAQIRIRELEAARRRHLETAQQTVDPFAPVEGPLLPPEAAQQLAAQSVPTEVQGGYDASLEHARKVAAMEAQNANEPKYILPGFPGGSSLAITRPQMRAPYDQAADQLEQQMARMSPHRQEWDPATHKARNVPDQRYGQIATQAAQMLRSSQLPLPQAIEHASKFFADAQKQLVGMDKPLGNEGLNYPQQLNKATAGARIAAGAKEKAAAGGGMLKPLDVLNSLKDYRKSEMDPYIKINSSLGHAVDSLSGNNPVSQKLSTLHMLRDSMGRLNETEIKAIGGSVSGIEAKIESALAVAEGEGYGSTHLQQLLDEVKGQLDVARKEVVQRGTAAAEQIYSAPIFDPHRTLIDTTIGGWFGMAGMEAPPTIQGRIQSMGRSKAPTQDKAQVNADLAAKFGAQ